MHKMGSQKLLADTVSWPLILEIRVTSKAYHFYALHTTAEVNVALRESKNDLHNQ